MRSKAERERERGRGIMHTIRFNVSASAVRSSPSIPHTRCSIQWRPRERALKTSGRAEAKRYLFRGTTAILSLPRGGRRLGKRARCNFRERTRSFVTRARARGSRACSVSFRAFPLKAFNAKVVCVCVSVRTRATRKESARAVQKNVI